MVTLTAILLSIIVDIEWEISKLAVSVNFSNGATVPVVFHFNGWSTKAVIVFFVVGGILKVSSVMTDWGLVVVSLEAVLSWSVKCGKCMRPFVMSMTTLSFLIKCHPFNGSVNFFITTKISAKILCPISNLSVLVVNGFSNWPLATCIWNFGGSSTLRMFFGALSPSHSGRLHWQMLPSPPRHLPLDYSQNLEVHRPFLIFVSGLLFGVKGDEPHCLLISHQTFPN